MVGRTQSLGAPRLPDSVTGGGRAAEAREKNWGTLVPPQYHHHTSDGLVSPVLTVYINVASYTHRNIEMGGARTLWHIVRASIQTYFLGLISKVPKFGIDLVMYNTTPSGPPSPQLCWCPWCWSQVPSWWVCHPGHSLLGAEEPLYHVGLLQWDVHSTATGVCLVCDAAAEALEQALLVHASRQVTTKNKLL